MKKTYLGERNGASYFNYNADDGTHNLETHTIIMKGNVVAGQTILEDGTPYDLTPDHIEVLNEHVDEVLAKIQERVEEIVAMRQAQDAANDAAATAEPTP